METVVEGARDVYDRVWVKVVSRPESGIPAMEVLRQRVRTLDERSTGTFMSESAPDVEVAPEREQRAIEHEAWWVRRILLGKRTATERSLHTAVARDDGHRAQGFNRGRCELLGFSLAVEAREQARALALRHGRKPRTRRSKGVGILLWLEPPAVVSASDDLLLGRILAGLDRCCEPRLPFAEQVPLIASKAPLCNRHEPVKAGPREPWRRPVGLFRLDPEIDVIPAQVAWLDRRAQRNCGGAASQVAAGHA